MKWLINTFKKKLGFPIKLFTDFELYLIKQISTHLSNEMQTILTDQISHFNLVQRTPDRDDIEGRETRFYWIKYGKVCLDYPLKFPVNEDDFTMAEALVKHKSGLTKVKIFIVRQVFFMIEFESNERAYYPQNTYEIVSLQVYL